MNKFLLVMLLLSVFSVRADDEIAVMKNEAGGFVVLTQNKCPIPQSDDFRLAYTGNNSIRIFGCWKLLSTDRRVHVVWITPDGDSHYRTYSVDEFTVEKII